MSDTHPAVVVRELSTLDECRSVDPFLASVWGPGTPMLGVELLRALAHAGGYVAGAYVGDDLVGASVGFLAYDQEVSLHSHVTGVSAQARGHGVGTTLKSHQRSWALDRGIRAITWTFDPLVRRNAWFNIAKLGALPRDYVVDFYGPMADDINGVDASDRLHIRWDLAPEQSRPRVDLAAVPRVLACAGEEPVTERAEAGHVLVATPPDIEGLRHRRPQLALTWRQALRDTLASEMSRGKVVGFTRDGEYLLRRDS